MPKEEVVLLSLIRISTRQKLEIIISTKLKGKYIGDHLFSIFIDPVNPLLLPFLLSFKF